MMIIQSPKKKKDGTAAQMSPEKPAHRTPKPPLPSFFASKGAAASNLSSSSIHSSSPAFGTPVHPLKPFNVTAPVKAAILPILLPPATLRPLAFRTFTKKHSLTLTSSALQELATFIGRHCGSGWREEGLAEKVLEEVAKSWKNRNGGVIVDGTNPQLKDILKTLEGNMSGGRLISGGRGLNRENSLTLESSQETDHVKTRLGLRPSKATLIREDSQGSTGLQGMNFEDDPDDESLTDLKKWLKVVSAHEQPQLTYNTTKKHFEREVSRPSLLPSATHKTALFRNRYNIIHQRLLRNEAFQTSAVADARTSLLNGDSPFTQSHKITPIANLLGRHGSHHMLLGMLIVLPTGNLAISDLTGAIALDLSHAVAIPEDSSWFVPGMIVLVDGVYEEEDESIGKGLAGSSGVGGTIGGRFQGFFVGQPPCEKRKITLGVSGLDGGPDHTIGGGFGWIDFLGVGSERAVGSRMRKIERRLLRQPARLADSDPDSSADVPHRGRIVVIGELNIDQPRALQALRKILALYAAEPEGTTPVAFVLAGNFTTHAVMARGDAGSGGSVEYKEAFDALSSVLADFPTLLSAATFVFIPGDNDAWPSAFGGGAAVPLPRDPVPAVFTSRVRRVFASAGAEAVWTTNPSRLSLFGPTHEIVLFRDDLSSRMQRAAIRLRKSNVATNSEGVAAEPTMTAADAGSDPASAGGNDNAMDVEPEDAPLSADGDEQERRQQKDETKGKSDEVPHDVRVARRLVKSLLDQGYLAPFRQAIRPVHWDLSAALYLYPLPTAAVLIDPGAPPFCVTYEGCHVMNPGVVLVAGRRGVGRWVEYEIGKVGKVRECLF
ncbi:hypothetical protein VTK73DRAFT_3157 [Phialemonium thermophilum]|uniref:DNA polymerase epsilon subunit B n=1 Tax=Phialemonium thermophilum TaxID=223376 RepID=A0ABR3X0W6_9PEZI